VVQSFVELVLKRLTREVRTTELRTMCLQVVIAGLYYDPALLMNVLNKIHIPNATDTIFATFFKQWLNDCDCIFGLHDRKLSVLGLCTLMDTPPNRIATLNENAQQIIPALLLLFSGLQRAYASRAEGDSDDEGEDADDDYEEALEAVRQARELDDDDDEIDDEGNQYIEKLEKSINDGDSDDDYEDEDEAEETALECYLTPLDKDDCPVDEYQIFRTVLANLEASDPAWFQALTGHLDEKQRKDLEQVFTLAEQRKAAAESKQIEKSGGYQFNQQTVPATFNFTTP